MKDESEVVEVVKEESDVVIESEQKTGFKKWQLNTAVAIFGVGLCMVGYFLGSTAADSVEVVTVVQPTNNGHYDPEQSGMSEAEFGQPEVGDSLTATSDQNTEVKIGSMYRKIYDSVYFQDEYVHDLDLDTLEYVGGDYIKDKNHVFYKGDIEFGVDPVDCTVETLIQCSKKSQWQSMFAPYSIQVAWNDEPVKAGEIIPAGQCRKEGYVVGVVTNGALKGGFVLVQNDDICDMWCSASTPPLESRHFVQFNDFLIPVDQASGFTFNDQRIVTKKEVNKALVDIPNSDYWLVGGDVIGFGSGLEGEETKYLFTDPAVGPVYRSKYDCFISERPDHVKQSYRLSFDYINNSTGVLELTFLNGGENTEAYQYIPSYQSCYDFFSEEEIRPSERLVKVGEFPNGDDVYKLSDSQDDKLVELYKDPNTLATFNPSIYGVGENKYTYDEYLSFNPYLYWKDPFGDWVQFMNRRFETAAEKCKPVVYLYPKKTGDFDVFVKPNGGFTKTIPEYGTGWHVTATPDSQITDKKTGETFPYLYWSGINTGIPKITEGWIVPQEEVEEFLVEKLAVLGLVENEIADFNEYWVPRLESGEAEQYKIMFLPQHIFEPLAPLTVVGDETPESVIRIMMYAQPATKGEMLPKQVLPITPSRTGFTVIEWGGAMLN